MHSPSLRLEIRPRAPIRDRADACRPPTSRRLRRTQHPPLRIDPTDGRLRTAFFASCRVFSAVVSPRRGRLGKAAPVRFTALAIGFASYHRRRGSEIVFFSVRGVCGGGSIRGRGRGGLRAVARPGSAPRPIAIGRYSPDDNRHAPTTARD